MQLSSNLAIHRSPQLVRARRFRGSTTVEPVGIGCWSANGYSAV